MDVVVFVYDFLMRLNMYRPQFTLSAVQIFTNNTFDIVKCIFLTIYM